MDARTKTLKMLMREMSFIQMEPGKHNKLTYLIFICVNTLRLVGVFYTLKLIGAGVSSGDVILFADGLASLAGHCQGFKATVCFDEARLQRIVSATEYFWRTPSTEYVEKNVYRALKSFRYMVYVTAFATVPVTMLLLQAMSFPGLYPDFPGSFSIFATMQAILFTHDSIVVSFCDAFFFCLVLMLYAQFSALNKRIREVGSQEGLQSSMNTEIEVCIRHHAFLLNICKDMIELYKLILGQQLIIVTVSICVETFVFGFRDAGAKVARLIYMIAILVDLAVYCLPAEYLSNVCAATSNAIFHSEYYENAYFARTYVKTIIQRANIDVNFTAGGLVVINKTTFVKIFNNFLSIYTLLRNFIQNN